MPKSERHYRYFVNTEKMRDLPPPEKKYESIYVDDRMDEE